jgi:hypothetical protein
MEDVERDVTGIEQAVEALSGCRPRPAQQLGRRSGPSQPRNRCLSARARAALPAAFSSLGEGEPQFDLRARRTQTSTRRAFKPSGLGRAVFPELPVAALCATGREPGPGLSTVPVPGARWLRTFGSFRVGRTVPTMTA